jgi:hypothetical protein
MELESRLNDLFGEDEKFAEESKSEDRASDYPLAELKNLVLSIDWEITDDILASFLNQINQLKKTYQQDKIVGIFLQILGSLGQYIKTNRGNAHPKTFKILNSVFSSLEEIVVDSDMAEAQKSKILRLEMKRYKELRQQISQKRVTRAQSPASRGVKKKVAAAKQRPQRESAVVSKRDPKPSTVTAAEAADDNRRKDRAGLQLAEAVEEIKQFVRAEFKQLRKDIQSLKTTD